MTSPPGLTLMAIPSIPLVHKGSNIVDLIISALSSEKMPLCSGDILVIAQKIVSKSEGRMITLSHVQPRKRAIQLAQKTGKDPRLVELVLSESTEVVRTADDLIIVAHR